MMLTPQLADFWRHALDRAEARGFRWGMAVGVVMGLGLACALFLQGASS